MRQFLIDLFAHWLIPLVSIALPLGAGLAASLRHERTADWAIKHLDSKAPDFLSRQVELRRRAANAGWRDGLTVMIIVVAAELFVAANWHAIGRAMFSE